MAQHLHVSSDRGEIILGWLTRIVAILGIVGLVGYDAVSIGVAATKVNDDASTAAFQATEVWAQTHDARRTYATVEAFAAEHGESVVADSFSVAPDGTVSVRLQRTAPTVLVQRLGATKKWAEQTGSGRARATGQ